MLSEVESAQRLLHSRRLRRCRRARAEALEDDILDARDRGASVVGLGPYRPLPDGPLSRAPPLPGTASDSALASASGDRRKRRPRRRRVFSGDGGKAEGEGWAESKGFPWGEEERVEVREALASDGEDDGEGEKERERKVLEAADMVMEDVDDGVKVRFFYEK